MKIVGIIGPYFSGGDRRLIDHNIANARAVTIAVANRFGESKLVGFFAPHSNTAKFERDANAPESYYHTLDDAIYDRACVGFVLLPGWEHSSGSRRDRERALARGLPVFALKNYTPQAIKYLLDELERWAAEKCPICTGDICGACAGQGYILAGFIPQELQRCNHCKGTRMCPDNKTKERSR